MKLTMPTPKARRYVYRIALAAGPLLIAGGAVSGDQWPLWVALVGAILVPGLADANVPTDDAP